MWLKSVILISFQLLADSSFRNTDNQSEIITTNQAETSTTVNIASDATVTDFQSSVVNYGYFFQEDIGFKDKVFLNFGFRNDFNTAFGSDIFQ